MIFLLDTNTCIRYLNGRAPNVVRRMQRHQPQDIVVCSVVKAELFYGAMKSNNPASTITKQNLFLNQFLSLPFDDQSASIYGRIRAKLTMMGTPVGPNDLMIASIALSRNLILVTHAGIIVRRLGDSPRMNAIP